jgi:putative transposase
VARFTAFRFTLKPTAEQEAQLRRHAGAARFAYNQCLGLVKGRLDARRRDGSVSVPWTGFDLINAFNRWKRSADAGRVMVADAAGQTTVVTTGLRWRNEVSQQVFEEAAVDLGRGLAEFTAARKAGKGRRVGFPRFKRKDPRVGSFRIRCRTAASGRTSIRMGEAGPRSVTLPKIGTLAVWDDTRRLRRMLTGGRATLVSATVRLRRGVWTVSLIVEAADLHPDLRHPERSGEDSGGWVGVDRGLTVFAVAARADGAEVLRVDDPPRPLRAANQRIRRLSRKLSRTQRDSRHQQQARARLNRAHATVAETRRRFIHEVANRLVETQDRIALEDLNVEGMMANHRLAAAIADAAWGEFARIVGYQQQWRGGQVMLVDRWFPSSKTCSACHTVAKSMPLSVRTFRCPSCGLARDRDLNAAVNLAAWAEKHHARVRDPDARGPVTNVHRGTRPAAAPPRGEPGRGC